MEIKMKPRVIVAETPEAVAEKAAADFAYRAHGSGIHVRPAT